LYGCEGRTSINKNYGTKLLENIRAHVDEIKEDIIKQGNWWFLTLS
jgi:hypothetical protein